MNTSSILLADDQAICPIQKTNCKKQYTNYHGAATRQNKWISETLNFLFFLALMELNANTR